MASRKTKARKPAPAHEGEASELSLTREVDALTAADLAALARRDSAPPPRSGRALDDLARTIEAPSTSMLAILDAADALLAHVGFRMLTAPKVAEAAGIAVDVVHAHFPDMPSLLTALSDRQGTAVVEAAGDAAQLYARSGAAAADVVEAAAREAARKILKRPALARAVTLAGDVDLLETRRRVGERVAARLKRVVAGAIPDADVAFAVLLAFAIAHDRVTIGAGRAFALEDLLDRIGLAVRTYLVACTTKPAQPSATRRRRRR